MVFGKKRNWEEQYDEDYVSRADRQSRISGPTVWIHVFGFCLTIIAVTGIAGLILGQAMLEKTLTMLASPVGIIWLALIFQSYFLLYFQQIWSALLCIGCWVILTFFGNSFVSNQLIYQLEKPHLNSNLDETPEMDVLFLLGGGTTTNLAGRAQLGVSGDRVSTAARLYRAGKAKLIVCSGTQLFKTSKDDMDPNEEAFQILSDLGIPEPTMARIQGQNTAEEMILIKEFLDQQKMSDAQIGIVTSAWHLSRAGRLAQINHLSPVLIPADFRAKYFTTGPGLLIPSGDALANSSRCIKEFLAYLVGR